MIFDGSHAPRAFALTRRAVVASLTTLASVSLLASAQARPGRLIIASIRVGPVRTVAEYEHALTIVQPRNRTAVVDVGATWCEFCGTLDRLILPDPRVANLLAHLALIRVDVTSMTDQNRELLGYLSVQGPPTLFVTDTVTGSEYPRTRSVGAFDVDNLASRLRPFVH
jgi:thiol:disulfide interchange protein